MPAWYHVSDNAVWDEDTGPFADATVADRFPLCPDELAMQELLFFFYTIVTSIDVPVKLEHEDGTREFLIHRDPENDLRGDETGTDDKVDSIESLGLLDLGGEPWLTTPESTIMLPMHFNALHWAGRSEALEQCIVRDKKRKHMSVQRSLERGFKRSRIMTARMLRGCKRKLVALGNVTNRIVTNITPRESQEHGVA